MVICDRKTKRILSKSREYATVLTWENHRAKGGLPSTFGGNLWQLRGQPSRLRKEGDTMYVTYAELFQFCTFIVALVGVCYTIFKSKRK